MQAFEESDAGRHAPLSLIGAAGPAEQHSPQRPGTITLATRVVALVRGLAERRRRRARPRLESWMAMDRRVLADIGIARADIQAVVDGAVPFAQLAIRGPAEAETGEPKTPPRRWRPHLCLVATRELDAAA